MSVEDAKVAFADAIDDACTERDHDLLGRAIASDERVTDAIDRLILEVQAEMACMGEWWVPWSPGTNSQCPRGTPCPSCTARMKLSEGA